MGQRKGSAANDPLGIVLIDKPVGMTSHGVVSRVRRMFGLQRVGHGGTLDPAAAGLLVVFVGRATRLVPYLGGGLKVYTTTLTFGVSTTTDDADGEVMSHGPVPDLIGGELEAYTERFVGEIDQVPPSVSAVHVDGERAYKRVRRGEAVEMTPRRVRIDAIEIIAWEPPDLSIQVTCGGGTYIRSLARDLGEALGTVAHVKALRREKSGQFDVVNAHTIESATDLVERGAIADVLTDPGEPLAACLGGRVSLDAEQEIAFRHGASVEGLTGTEGPTPVLSESGGFLGVGELDGNGCLTPTVVMTPN